MAHGIDDAAPVDDLKAVSSELTSDETDGLLASAAKAGFPSFAIPQLSKLLVERPE